MYLSATYETDGDNIHTSAKHLLHITAKIKPINSLGINVSFHVILSSTCLKYYLQFQFKLYKVIQKNSNKLLVTAEETETIIS